MKKSTPLKKKGSGSEDSKPGSKVKKWTHTRIDWSGAGGGGGLGVGGGGLMNQLNNYFMNNQRIIKGERMKWN